MGFRDMYKKVNIKPKIMNQETFDPKVIDAILDRMEGIEESLEGLEGSYDLIYNKLSSIEELLVKFEVKKKPFSEVFSEQSIKKYEGEEIKQIFDNLGQIELNERQEEFVSNVRDYFTQKGYISEKQLNALKKIL